jgi:hypothetical protein
VGVTLAAGNTYTDYVQFGPYTNGAILENGNFVHLGPKGAKLVKLAIGEKLSVVGYGNDDG